MPGEKRSSLTTHPDASRRRRRIVICVVVVVMVILALWFWGPGILAWWARQMAARQIDVGAISAAQRWLVWSGKLDADDGKTELLEAACFRHLGRQDRWREAIRSAEQKGAPAAGIRQEARLGAIRWGEVGQLAEGEVAALIDAGVSPHEAAATCVYGLLARAEPRRANQVLDAWAADYPEDAHVAFMRGVYWWWLGRRAEAQSEFENALDWQPRHQLARTALAQLFEEQERFDEALKQYVALAADCPESETANAGLARLLRKLGRVGEARAVLEALALRPEASLAVAAEMGQIELDSGDLEKAARWFDQADLDQAHVDETLRAAGSTFALEGELPYADRLFARVDAARNRSLALDDMRVRLAVNPNDAEAAGELERLSRPPLDPAPNPAGSATQRPGDGQGSPAASGPELYALHCAACHGANGDGNGRAARHLFPRPRNLRTGKCRLVSTRNGVPTLEDLEAGIRQGMPGTAMAAFDNLNQDQRMLLAREVLRLNRDGVREQFVSTLKSEGEEIDEDEVREVVDLCTTPGEVVPVPQIGPPNAESIARGKDAYFELGCDNCHGADGTGAWDTPLFDDKGRPSPPRDLVHEPFKGGPEPQSIYLRVLLGMPGTPHPACLNVPEDQLIGLVHYCRWLSREPKWVLTNHQRAIEATSWAYLTTAGPSPAP